MPSHVTLADFNRIASGTYNAGQIDLATGKDGSRSLVKINNHVWQTSRNSVQLAPERVLEVKEAFVAALKVAEVSEENLAAIRKELGIPADMDATAGDADMVAMAKERFTPLTRQQVRTILDMYANGGRGFTTHSREAVSAKEHEASLRTSLADAKTISRRDRVNAMAPAVDASAAHGLVDAFSFISGARSLKGFAAAHRQVAAGGANVSDQELQQGFLDLFKGANKLLAANERDSGVISLWGMQARIVKDAGGTLSIVLGTGAETAVNLGASAQELVEDLIDRALDESETLGAGTVKEVLNMVQGRDVANGLDAGDRTSQTRRLAAKILEGCATRVASGGPAFKADALVSSGSYDTKLLAQLAERALNGETAEALDTLDAISFISGAKTLAETDAARGKRVGRDPGEESSKLRNGFKELFSKGLQLLSGDDDHSNDFVFCGTPAKIVRGGDGNLSIELGKGPEKTTVRLGCSAHNFVGLLTDRALDASETLGAETMKDMLTLVVNRDVANRIPYNDRDSLSRRFAANILAGYAKGDAAFTANELVSGDYQTMVLAHMAQKALAGEDVEKFNTRESLNRYHDGLKQDSAGLSTEMKSLLEQVKDIPFAKPAWGNGEFVVSANDAPAPAAAADKAAIAQAAGKLSLDGAGGVKGIKDFIADLVFSDETMVADVTSRLPGETMRSILSDERKLFLFAEIVRDRGVIDKAVAPDIRDVVKDGFDQLVAVLDGKFKLANGGESLADAAKKEGFVGRFAEFFMNPEKLPRDTLAQFDAIILAMSTTGCEKLQDHVNEVFHVAGANELGAVTTDPYREKSGDAIVAELKDKTLNQILDAAATSDAPGQVGLFKQVMSNYFMQLRPADKRSAFAASLRYADTFESGETEAARNAFTGAVLKGSGPILQKMMQGLPREMMGEFSAALEDMKAHLAPIPRKIVQAHLMKMIQDSQARYDANDRSSTKITSIEVKGSLGAASVGEAFLCEFKYVDGSGSHLANCVVKIMRHDAEARVLEEGKIFTAAAAKIPGMAKTWEGQFKQYMTEFDFRNEARNVEQGVQLYGVRGVRQHVLTAHAPNVTSMKLSSLVPPQKNAMVAERVVATTVDKFFKDSAAGLRQAASSVFEHDPATGHVLWKDGPVDPATKEPVKVPVLRLNATPAAVANLNRKFMDQYGVLRQASDKLQQATRAWFFQALIGDGKFHGDVHAGNLMFRETGEYISFIDFGNLYTLDGNRADGVNEKTELLRVILGAAFRKTDFILKGFEKLMSPEGRAALADAKTREKAEKILNTVLGKGSFSTNIVYRLQAAVSELQKLGLELPPPINCFILSLVRLSNTVTEINSIMNQCRAMMDAADTIHPRTAARDELDLAGRAFDVFAKAASGPAKDKDARIFAAANALMDGKYGIGGSKVEDKTFLPGGAYYNSVVDRLAKAKDPRAEAEKLAGIISQYSSDASSYRGYFDELNRKLDEFRAGWDAASTPSDKDAAIRAFAQSYASLEMGLAKKICSDITGSRLSTDSGNPEIRHMPPPAPFATAIMDLIEANFEDFCEPFVKENSSFTRMLQDDLLNELGYKTFLSRLALATDPEGKVRGALKKDAESRGGDTGYQINIGV